MSNEHHLDYKPFVVQPGKQVRLGDYDPGHTAGFASKEEAAAALEDDVMDLAALQEKLWAAREHAVLIILQGIDAAGKDSTIKHVMSRVNPQGCSVVSFKAPSLEEQRHPFLWRPVRFLPACGQITIFNRSYYEEVLVVRVHPEFLDRQWVWPVLRKKADEDFWLGRFEQINQFEAELVESGTVVLKFFLNVSRGEQRKRFLERLTDKEKLWKFDPLDYQERTFWDDYKRAYEAMLSATSTKAAPWHVVPADHKWFTRACVADIIASRIEGLNLKYPSVSPKQQAQFEEIRAKLEAEK